LAIHDISIKFGQETGFSPDLTTFYVPIPDWEKNDPIKFKAEFYDINNNKATNSGNCSKTSSAINPKSLFLPISSFL